MTRRLATNYAKNYCNRTLIVKVIVENVVTCFLGHSVVILDIFILLVLWFTYSFLADRTNGRAYATLLRPSVVVVCRL